MLIGRFFGIMAGLIMWALPVIAAEETAMDTELSRLESIRTQAPAAVAETLTQLASQTELMSLEQRMRFYLLKAHSLAMSGEPDQAIAFLTQQLDAPAIESQIKYQARMLVLLANIYSYQNLFTQSLLTLQQAIPLFERVDDIENQVYGYRLIAELYTQIDNYEEALHYATLLYRQIDIMSDSRLQCFSMFVYADSFYGSKQGRLATDEELLALYKKSFGHCQEANEAMLIAGSLRGQAEILLRTHQYTAAEALLKQALSFAESIGYAMEQSKILLALNDIDAALGRDLQAHNNLTQALSHARKLENSELLYKSYVGLSVAAEQSGDFVQALEYRKLYDTHFRKVIDDEKVKSIAFQMIKLNVLDKEREIRLLNKERDLYLAQQSVKERERTNMLMFVTILVGGVCFLGILALVGSLQKRKYMRLAKMDSLTGIYNRGAGQNLAEDIFIQVLARGGDFSLVLFDLDHFKQINDKLGHATGDWALKKVVEVLKSQIRSGDIFARIGGEEFAIMLPYADEVRALELAEHCREQINNIDTHLSGHKFQLSASFGVSSLEESDLSLDPLFHRADVALYAAKHGGRNRVVPYLAEMGTQVQQASAIPSMAVS